MQKILIDLDGTILDFNKGEKISFVETIKHFFNYTPSEYECKIFSFNNEYFFNQYANGNMERRKFHHSRFFKTLKFMKLEGNVFEINDYYVDLLKYQSILYDDALDALKYLSSKYDIYVASNGMTEVQMKRIENIRKYFKGYYISEAIGFNKPNIKFFEYIFRNLNEYDKSKYIIIGDRLESDILGGINAGIKTIYLNRNNINFDIKPDYEIKGLNEIKNVL